MLGCSKGITKTHNNRVGSGIKPDGRGTADRGKNGMPLVGSQWQRMQWVWGIRKVLGRWENHSMQMASLRNSRSSFSGGYTWHHA